MEGWDTTNGAYVKQCVVEATKDGQGSLRVVKTRYAGGREYTGGDARMTLDAAYLETPIEQRLQKQREDVQWLIDQLKD